MLQPRNPFQAADRHDVRARLPSHVFQQQRMHRLPGAGRAGGRGRLFTSARSDPCTAGEAQSVAPEAPCLTIDELLAQIGSTRLTTRASQTMAFIKEEGGSTFLAAPAARIVNGEAAAAKAVLGSDQLVI